MHLIRFSCDFERIARRRAMPQLPRRQLASRLKSVTARRPASFPGQFTSPHGIAAERRPGNVM